MAIIELPQLYMWFLYVQIKRKRQCGGDGGVREGVLVYAF